MTEKRTVCVTHGDLGCDGSLGPCGDTVDRIEEPSRSQEDPQQPETD